MSRKTQLGVVLYGDLGQRFANEQQFEYLSRTLADFTLKLYDFHADGRAQMLADFTNAKLDVVLKNAYGRAHEIDVEMFLAAYRIPFLGSDAASTHVATSKILTKQYFREYQIPVAQDVIVERVNWEQSHEDVLAQIEKTIGFPCILKDPEGVDSRGIEIARSKEQCIEAIKTLFKKRSQVLIEQYIADAMEIACLVVGTSKPTAYPPVELRSSGGMISQEEKDTIGTAMKVPAELSQQQLQRVQEIAVAAHRALGCRTFSRADILQKDGTFYVLEVDVHPGFREKSSTILSAHSIGESTNQLFTKFLHS